MKYTLDRIENGMAVLVPQDSARMQVIIPVSLLPAGTREGDILTVTIERDPDATEAERARIAGIIERIREKR